MASINEKLNYINETKSLIKDKLNNLGSEITNQTTFRDYADKIEDLYEEWPKINDEDTTITLNNTKKGKMNLQLKGNINQFTTTGKNKFAKIDGTQNHNGLETVVTQDNVFHIHGLTTAAENWFTLDITKMVLPAGTYTFSAHYDSGSYSSSATSNFLIFLRPHGGSSNIATLYPPNENNLIKEASFTIEQETAFDIYGYCVANLTFTNYVMKLQVESGSTATSYEPYTGGIASPNPNYPQNIEVVTGENFIKISGKNQIGLINKETTTKNNLTYSISNNILNVNGTANAKTNFQKINFNILSSGSKTLRIIKDGGTFTSGSIGLSFRDSSDIQLNYIEIPYNGQIHTKNIDITNLDHIYLYATNGTVFANASIKFMLSNSSSDSYESFEGNTYSINLGNLELCKNNEIQDYLYKENNKWYKNTYIKKVILDGSDTGIQEISSFDATALSGSYQASFSNLLTKSTTTNYVVFSDKFFKALLSDRTSKTNIIYTYSDGMIRIATNLATTKTDFLTWLSTHNTIIYYELTTPIQEEITNTTLITQLNSLEQAISYNNQTNISQTNDNLPFIISASALLKNSN